jgi:ABC transporter C-terminal domain
LYAQLADPLFLRDGVAVAQSTARLAALDDELTALADRWEYLETIAAGA